MYFTGGPKYILKIKKSEVKQFDYIGPRIQSNTWPVEKMLNLFNLNNVLFKQYNIVLYLGL